MKSGFTESRFSRHFNRLEYMGMWPSEKLTTDPSAKKLFFFYRAFCWLFLMSAVFVQMVDLYMVMGNFRRVTYNFCTSVIVIGIIIKVCMLYRRKEYLNELRYNLWKDSIKLNNPEDIAIYDTAFSQLENISKLFYTGATVLLLIWLTSSYFSYKWGPRQVAFAAYFPFKNINDDSEYVPVLVYQAFCGFYIVFMVIEVDLAMLSLILQMEAYYQILIRNILKLNDIYGYENDEGNKTQKSESCPEVNVYLKREIVQRRLKLLIIRQLEIIHYSENFEHIYSYSMLLQLFAASFLIVTNGLELSMFLHEISVKLCFQSGYVLMTMVDVLFICYYFTRFSTESGNVGMAAYSTVWYKMDTDIRKSLCMIMIRSQKTSKMTAGKLFQMDLNTFLHMLRNIYSWLMLFRHLGSY